METRFGLATTLCTMSNVYEKKGDFEKAIDVMRRGMECIKRQETRQARPWLASTWSASSFKRLTLHSYASRAFNVAGRR
jgi:Cdc6-like AAA superfamily ATPase